MTLGKKEEDTLSVEIFTGQKWEWEAFRSETVDLKENGDQEKENSQQDTDVLTPYLSVEVLERGLRNVSGKSEGMCLLHFSVWC